MSGGGGSSQTTTVQKADPWGPQQPYLQDVFKEAQRLYQTRQPEFYPGQTVAPYTPTEQEAQQRALGYAGGGLSQLAGQTGAANQFLLGDVLSAESNPYMADYARAAIRPVFESLREEALPRTQSGFLAAGQLGTGRQGVAEAQTIQNAMREAGDITSRLYSDMYGQNLEAMQRGLALAPQTAQLGLMPSQVIGGVGAQERGYQQALIDEAVARQQFEQAAPWDALAAYQGLVQGSFGGTGTMQQPGPSTGQRLVGAATTGLGTYAAMSAIPALGPAAPFVAGGMALMSLFS